MSVLTCRHWPVIVASVDSLPQAVASGGSLHSGGDNAFPLRLSEASSSGRPNLALPVMALGTQVGSRCSVATLYHCWAPAACLALYVLLLL